MICEFIPHSINGLYIVGAPPVCSFTEVLDMGVNEIVVIGHIHVITHKCSAIAVFADYFILVTDKIQKADHTLVG
jgi:hypothetical protein